MTATISIVIPTHNRRELLLRTLASALAQEAIDFEVVVIDDGSTDGTAEAIRVLNDRRIRVLRNERSVGVAAARNMGVEAARGAWIALLDDDDLWSPQKLQQQLGAAKATGSGWVYAGSVEVDQHGVIFSGDPPPSPEKLLASLLQKNLMPAGSSNVIVRADLFRDVGGFDVRLRLIADWDLWLRLAPTGPPACVPQPLVAYRFHFGQSTLDSYSMIAEGRIVAERHGANLNSVRRWLAWSYLRRGERFSALREYARAGFDGDLSSFGRAAVVALHPRPMTVRRRFRGGGLEWQRSAESWLRPLRDK